MSFMKKLSYSAATIALLAAAPAAVHAQVTSAQLRGTVVDDQDDAPLQRCALKSKATTLRPISIRIP